MVEIAEIRDRKSFEAWLDALPRETPEEAAWAREIEITLAVRASARVLPVWWSHVLGTEDARNRGLTALPFLRVLVVPEATAALPTIENREAHTAAYYAAAANSDAAHAPADGDRNAEPNSAAKAAAYAAAVSALSAATRAADAAGPARIFLWNSIGSDCYKIDRTEPLWNSPLWPQDNPFDKAWREIKAQFAKRDETETWAFWIHWYDGLLTGTAPDPASPMMQEIALLPDEVWKDEAEALRQINAIWEGAQIDEVIQRNPLGHQISRNAQTGKLVSEALEPRDMSQVIDDIRAALREFKARCKKSRGNLGQAMVSALDCHIAELRAKLGKLKDNPRELLRAVEETRRAFAITAEKEAF